MKFSTQQFVLATLSVLLTASAAQVVEAAEVQTAQSVNVHQLRMAEFDSRNKRFDVKEGFSVHQLRLAEFDRRNKASLSTVSLIEQRYSTLDRGGSK